MDKLKTKFQTIISYKLEEDLNEIFICQKKKIQPSEIKKQLINASREINIFFKKNNTNCDQVDENDFVDNLQINIVS